MKFKITLLLSSTVLAAFLYSCDSINNYENFQSNMAQQVFSNSITSFNVRVFYEPTAVPYTGTLNVTHDTWDLTKESYQALFQTHAGRVINTPVTTSDMVLIGAQGVTSWTGYQLISLGNSVAASFRSGNNINISVIFVRGNYGGNTSVLGVHFTGYPYVFIFKDVVTSVGGTANDQKYVEQAVVVHEIGHAVGLVNNGVPMVTAHEDLSHQKHSNNNQCVMYWEVESSSTVLNSLSSLIIGGSLNLFSADTLNDGRSYHP